MNDMTKTVSLVIVGALALLAAWFTRPTLPTKGPEKSLVNQPLFKDFTPSQATNLEIISYDEATGTVKPFQVAQVNGVWTIPSHDGYPADAKDQMGRAAASLMDLKVLDVVSSDRGAQENYGVVDPKEAKPGARGVGTSIVLKDSSNNPLVDMIVGKEVPEKSELRYVRKIGDDKIYVVKVQLDRLPTQFGEWIEKNLLKMDVLDFKQVEIQDYSVDALQGTLNRRGQMLLANEDGGAVKWKILEDQVVQGSKAIDLKLGSDEEVNAAKLDEMKRSLGDLKIVDVRRKPKGLSAELKTTGDLHADQESMQSLIQRGFYLAQTDGGYGLFSNEGEIRATMKTGVEYVLRFGNLAMTDASVTKKDGKDAKKNAADAGHSRYIFVVAEYNPNIIPKPQLEPLPEDKSGSKEKDQKKDGEKKDNEKKADAAQAERERIEKDNKRKQEEYDAKVKSARDKVKDLNARFADWYYIISNDVYKNIHLSRADIVKKKDKKGSAQSGDGHDHESPFPPASPALTPTDFEKLKANMPGKDELPVKADEPAKKADAEPVPKADEPAVKIDPEPPVKSSSPTALDEPAKKDSNLGLQPDGKGGVQKTSNAVSVPAKSKKGH